jgi:hypothetical protein
LANTVLELLRRQPRRGEFVFGIRSAFSGWGQKKLELDARTGPLSPSWVLHDLRRTAATGMADIGVQPQVIEAVLNHVSGHKGGIAGIYNRAQDSAEKAQALARRDEQVRSIVEKSPAKVVKLRGSDDYRPRKNIGRKRTPAGGFLR